MVGAEAVLNWKLEAVFQALFGAIRFEKPENARRSETVKSGELQRHVLLASFLIGPLFTPAVAVDKDLQRIPIGKMQPANFVLRGPYHWRQGQTPTPMIQQKEGFCFFNEYYWIFRRRGRTGED